jgi:hypothetical protein
MSPPQAAPSFLTISTTHGFSVTLNRSIGSPSLYELAQSSIMASRSPQPKITAHAHQQCQHLQCKPPNNNISTRYQHEHRHAHTHIVQHAWTARSQEWRWATMARRSCQEQGLYTIQMRTIHVANTSDKRHKEPEESANS